MNKKDVKQLCFVVLENPAKFCDDKKWGRQLNCVKAVNCVDISCAESFSSETLRKLVIHRLPSQKDMWCQIFRRPF